MASTAVATKEKTTNRAYVVALLKSNPGVKHTGNEICQLLDISPMAKTNMMCNLKKQYPEIKADASKKGFKGVYWWENQPARKITPVKDLDDNSVEKTKSGKYPWGGKNEEGYSDPTASVAIDKVDKEAAEKEGLPKFGEVWEVKHATGDLGKFFVLWSTETQASGFYISDKTGISDRTGDIYIKYEGEAYLGSTLMICAKPVRYMVRKLWDASATEAKTIRRYVAKQLDIKPVIRYEEKEKIVYREKEVPVEKIVYKDKIVEKPVEKIVYRDKTDDIPSGCVDAKDATINLLFQKVSILEDIIDRLLPKKGEC